MSEVTLIFPHQLFRNHPALQKDRTVWLVEEGLFFNQYRFHVQKLIFHRASMKAYAQYLSEAGYEVQYVPAADPNSDMRRFIREMASAGVKRVHYADPTDDWLSKRIQRACQQLGVKYSTYPSPLFLNTMEETAVFFDSRKSYFQTAFYTHQRKLRGILVDDSGGPAGGKWTFDTENRRRFPAKEPIPELPVIPGSPFVAEARCYVARYFPDNPGTMENPLFPGDSFYPVTFRDTRTWWEDFLTRRLPDFGPYEDAMVAKAHVLHHGLLTPMLNVGLITPDELIHDALEYRAAHDTPLASLEGFIRQVMGWREFIRIVYEREGSFQRTRNYWGFHRKIPPAFWNGTTGILPVDTVIRKVLHTGYCHHIERLMVLGNFMLLCEFDPDEAYRWFMEFFIDAYDWVMVPNVYGMTQFADGGLMTTKPYISGSNYLRKMGDWEKGPWEETWDGLFWRFIDSHRDFFQKNPRTGMMVKTLDRMNEARKKQLFANANRFLEGLTT